MSQKKKLPSTVWALGLVSLLMDTSSELVHGLLPVYLVGVMGASYSMVGLIEGLGEGLSLVLKVFSGSFSDWWGKRKPLVILGYSMGALSKPLFAIAPNPFMILCARLFDRTGKGIRGAPRDALVADATPAEQRGEAFGLRQSMDTIGAFLGPLLAIYLMWLTSSNYRLIFWIAVIPGALAVAVLFFGVKEAEPKENQQKKKLNFQALKEFKAAFWFVVAIGAICQVARFSEAFLILRAQNVGLSLALAPLVLVAMNIVYAISAYPIGWLSDRMRREYFLLAGLALLVVADLILSLGTGLLSIFIGIVIWGLHMGFTQGIFSAMVADHSPANLRGTAFGFFNLLSAFALFLASGIAGFLWDHHGPQITFFASGVFAIFGMISLMAFTKK